MTSVPRKALEVDNPPLMARLVLAFIGLVLVAFILWSSLATVSEIARGDGKVIPQSKTQIVQASEPGVVTDIAVELGQTVSKGQLLLRIDDTSTASSLGESQARLSAGEARIARLQIEINDLFGGKFICPERSREISDAICENEEKLLLAHKENFRSKAAVLDARLTQRVDEVKEAEATIAQIDEILAAMKSERDKIAPLVKRNLHPEIDLLRLDRQIVEQEGRREITAQSINRLEAARKEAQLQIDELNTQVRQEARKEMSEVLAETGVLEATIKGASDRVRRTDIVSPVDGIVNTLEINTIGAFLQAGEVVAGIVPETDTLLIEARISPRDVAFVQRGQHALVKLTAYDFSIFGGLDGVVSNVSADSIVDQKTGETFYTVLITTGNAEIRKNGTMHPIRPGMVASVDIITGEKTILSYLAKPLNKARYEALTER